MHFRASAIILAASVLSLTFAPLVPLGSAEALTSLPGSVPPFVADGAPQAGSVDPSERIELAIVLRFRDELALRAIADSPQVLPLSHEELLARFAPTPEAAQRVSDWAVSRALPAPHTSDDRRILTLTATAGAIEDAFRVELREYRVGARTLRAAATDPLVPAAIAPDIESVIGLNEVPLWTHHVARPDPRELRTDSGTAPYAPADLRNAYDVATPVANGYDGRGRTVAMTGWGPASQSDLDAYDTAYSLPAVTITHRDASGTSSCPGSANLEWDLDVQMEHALAPGAAVREYCGSAASLSAMLSVLDRAVSDNVADVISNSWGSCDYLVSSSTASSYESTFASGAVQGQSFFTSSGDGGSRECSQMSSSYNSVVSPSFPATAPHTTSVGGTRLTMSGSSYASEATWNTCTPCSDGSYEAAGGGPSSLYSRPSWETQPTGGSMRSSSDWSADADPSTGVSTRSGGSWYTVGGTSVSSPMTAGMWADVVSAGTRLKNAAERLWPIGTGSSAATGFRDITTGNNGDYAAGTGYDYPTGLGSPRVAGLISLLILSLPRNLTAAGSDLAVTLSWQAPADPTGVSGYRLYRGTTSGGEALVATLGNVTTATDSGLSAGTTYYYQVAAILPTGDGGRSNEAVAVTFGAPLAPPTGLVVTPAGLTLTTTWSAPIDDGGSPITGYRVVDTLPSGDPTLPNRLLGNESWALAMDARDRNVPTSGRTYDATGHGKDGVVNGATATTGMFGGAYSLNGANTYITVPETGAMAQGTVTMWLKVDGDGVPGTATLFFKQWPGHWNDLVAYAGTNVYFNTQQSSTAVQTAPNSVVQHVWFHLALSWGPGGKHIYLNATDVANNSDSTGVGSQYTTTMLGNSPNDVASGGFVGVMDDVREYAVQLGAADIASIMNGPYANSTVVGTTPATPRSFTHDGLEPRSTHAYSVAAVNRYGVGPLSLPASGTTSAFSDRPTGLVATPGAGQVALQWVEPTEPALLPTTGYHVYASSAPGQETLLAHLGATTSYTDSGLPANAYRYYRVSQLNANGETPLGAEAFARVWGTPRAAPGRFTAQRGPGGGEITLSWAAPTDDGGTPITGYAIHRCDGGQDASYAQTSGTIFVDSGLGPAVTHCYRVAGLNALGEGALSTNATATTFGLPSVPRALSGAPGPSRGNITITWTAPETDGGTPITTYSVYVGSASGAETLATTTTATRFVEGGLADLQTRYYVVTASNIAGEGPRTLEISVTTVERPHAPRTISVQPSVGRIPKLLVQWSAPDNAAAAHVVGYHVFRGTAPGAGTFLTDVFDPSTSYADAMCRAGTTCYYFVTAFGPGGESGRSAEVSAAGDSSGIATPGAPTTGSTFFPRLIGHEITVLQMDSDDTDQPLSGYTKDSSLAQDHGKVVGPRPAPGRFGAAYHFSGPGNYVSLDDAITDGLSEGTIMTWIVLDRPQAGHILHKVLRGSWSDLLFEFDATGALRFQTSDATSPLLTTPPGMLPSGTYVHVAASWGPMGKRIFVNGALQAWDTDTTGTGVETTTTELGIDPNDHFDTGLTGSLDEFRIYDVQLAQGDLQSLMAKPYQTLDATRITG